MLKGITIQLQIRTKTGEDEFGVPVYAETWKDVENVLVGNPSSDEVLDTLSLTGRKAIYELGIPKGNSDEWVNRKVRFFGQTFCVIEEPIEGIENLIPLSWNKKVKVERYGGED